MANCSNHRNPLQRSGASQLDRILPGLAPDFIRIDERRYSDWIVFAIEFSKYLTYYESKSGASLSGWQAFFTKDVSAVLGTFAVQNIESYRIAVQQRLAFLRDDDHAADDAGLKKRLSEAISAVLTLAKSLDDYYLQLDEAIGLKSTLQKFIKAKLAPAFRRLLSYYKAAKTLGLYQTASDPDWKILNHPLTDAEVVITDPAGFAADWWDAVNPNFASVAADGSVFGTGSVFGQVSHAANHFLFTSIFDLFTEAFARFIGEAEAALGETLEKTDSHQPHYVLFLTFLKLFRNGQAQLNGITWRHLDYYYKDILRLEPKGSEPNHVHLVAELAKFAAGATLPAGTLFKAGKDSLGKDVAYALDQETTFNRAEVVEHKAIYRVDPLDSWQDGQLGNSRRVFAAPVMNSADGLGAELLSPLKEWHPFLNKSVAADGKITSINMPAAEIGFAVASHYLFLAEGTRTIRLRFGGDAFGSFPKERLRCLFTTEKSWLEKVPTLISIKNFSDGGLCTEIEIVLAGTDPAITAFNAKVHGDAFATDAPVVKCILKNEPGADPYGLDLLEDISLSRLEVQVLVGAPVSTYTNAGAKQLFLANANGKIDSSKPFQAWGAVPEKDSALIVGSKELFTKKNASFNLHIEWANRPSSVTPSPNAHLQFLEGGVWETEPSNSGGHICKASSQRTFTADVPVPPEATIDYRAPYPDYNPASQAGFMRVVLDGNFGQEAYIAALTAFLTGQSAAASNPQASSQQAFFIKGTSEDPVQAKAQAAEGVLFTDTILKNLELWGTQAPVKPYLPVINSLYLTYTAVSGPIDLTDNDAAAIADRAARLFHVGPFGVAEQEVPIAGSSGHSLVPQFRSAGGLDNLGEWYIGLRNLAPRQAVNVLFQLLEGTTNPLLSKPLKHVEWSYWGGNRWIKFDERDLRDSTRQLVQSGIITFVIPADAVTDKGILPHGLLWLRASVTEKVGAVCSVLSVFAQAMQATFLPQGNAPDFLDQPLPAGTIAKLKEPNAQIKKISQPYPSFGGRQTESSHKFYLRSSERLRHKGRAVTIWDYERMVLEAFPQLYKVKCLNHTRIEDNPNASLAIHNESHPGYVAVVTIPNLVGRNDTNVLKPYTNQGLLSEIQDFLKTRVTGQLVPGSSAAPQVNVNVCNPLFEEIFIDFALQLREGYDDFTLYREQLQGEITRFLSPWAFSGQGDVQFGGRIPKSVLINFIEERPYVDFITDVVLKQKPENQPVIGNLEEAVATTSRSILVSAVSTGHNITQYGT